MIKEVSLDLTYRCPFKCVHCSNPPDSIDFGINNLSETLMYLLKNYHIEIVEFGGGEPLLHGKFEELSKKIPLNVKKILYTSGGVGLTSRDHICCKDVLFLKELGYMQVNVSFYSANANTHNFFFGGLSVHEKAIKTIENLIAEGIRVCCHVVLTKVNYDNVISTISFVEKLGVKEVRLLRFVPQGRGKENRRKLELLIDSKEIIYLLSKAKNLYPDLKISIAGFPEIEPCRPHESIIRSCPAGIEFLHIKVDGSIVPCPSFKNSSGYAYDVKDINEMLKLSSFPRKHCFRSTIN